MSYENDKNVKKTTYALMSSPEMDYKIRIKNPKVPISTSARGLEELKYVEMQMNKPGCEPDFGYENDNFLLDRGARSGWETLTELLGNPDRY